MSLKTFLHLLGLDGIINTLIRAEIRLSLAIWLHLQNITTSSL